MRISSNTPAWERANITDPETGLLDRPFPSAHLAVPERIELDLEGDRILWVETPANRVAVPRGLLSRFVRLGPDPPAKAIVRFARAHGPLDMMGFPHDRAAKALPVPFTGGESLARWRYVVAAARAILDVTAEVRAGRTPQPATWGPLFSGELPPHERPSLDLERSYRYMSKHYHVGPLSLSPSQAAWQDIMEVINTWTVRGGVHPILFPNPTGPDGDHRLVMYAPSLFGTLAILLAQAVAGVEGWAVCRACGRPLPAQRGRGRRRVYCGDCGPAARARMASKAYYHRHKAEGEKAHGKTKGEASRKPRR